MTFSAQMAHTADPVAGNMLKSSTERVFMSGKDAKDKTWHFEPLFGYRAASKDQSLFVVAAMSV